MTAPCKAEAATTSPLAPAAERLRDSARWLVITFGAVAGVVFTGISIAGFGSVDPDTAPDQFWTALAGAGAALVGVLGALLVAMSLAAASSLTIAELSANPTNKSMRAVRAALQRDPILAPWENNIGKFVKEVCRAAIEFDTNQKNWVTSTRLDPERAYADRASERLTRLSRVQTIVMETASYLRLRHRFGRARWWIFAFLALAAAGATAFVWATGTAANESVPVKTSTATWTVPDGDRDIVGTQLGGSCTYDLDEVPVVLLGKQVDGKESEIVTAAGNACAPVRLVVDSKQLVREK